MMEKNSQQRERIATLNDHVNDLLVSNHLASDVQLSNNLLPPPPPPLQEAKMHRDELLKEKEQLIEANKHFHMHTNKLKEKVDALSVCEPIVHECM